MIYYFDNAATTKIKPEVLEAMMPFLKEEYGNPSSLYSIGRNAKRAIENARAQVAKLINCNKNEIFFTSCGSESDNTAIKGIANYYKKETSQILNDVDNSKLNQIKKNHIITTKIEHHAILETCKILENEGFDITYLDVDENGIIDLEELKNTITDKTFLISIMFANNEIGTIEPIEEIAKIAKEKNVVFHTDAVQALGNTNIDVKKMGIDMLSMSGHKINAPKGVGALYVRNGIKFEKLIDGGHQEKNMRAGTENIAGIVGFGKACEIANMNIDTHIRTLKKYRDYYIKQVKANIDKTKINGSMEHRLPGNANISFIGVDSTALLLELDKKGICASSGSACNSSENTPSHVLAAIGLNEEMAKSALRTTFSEYNNKAQIDYLVDNLKYCVNNLRIRFE